jgi:hypothetical protein
MVGVLLGVEGEVVLWDLAVAFALGVGYEELLMESVNVYEGSGWDLGETYAMVSQQR